jgi:predicted dehydrogenase
MPTFKVGLIGTGYFGLVHLDMLPLLGGVEITAVADPNVDPARAAAAKYGIPKVYADAGA